MNPTRRTALPLLFLLAAFPDTIAAEPTTPAASALVEGGWGEARWGMTVDEVLASVPRAAKVEKPKIESDGSAVLVKVSGHERAGHAHEVMFGFDRTGRLAWIVLHPEKWLRAYQPETPETREAIGAARLNWQLMGGRAWYRDLAEELARIHGKPSSEKDETPKNEVRREKIWDKPDARVRLYCYSLYGVWIVNTVSYHATQVPPPSGG